MGVLQECCGCTFHQKDRGSTQVCIFLISAKSGTTPQDIHDSVASGNELSSHRREQSLKTAEGMHLRHLSIKCYM